MDLLREITKPYMRTNVPRLRSGDVIRVYERVADGDKERTQLFEGLVIAVKHGAGTNATFKVRKLASNNVGVERTFPLHSPNIQKVEILRHEKVRRSKLYYVRALVGKKTRRKKSTAVDEMFAPKETIEDMAEEPLVEEKNGAEPEQKEKSSVDNGEKTTDKTVN